MNLLIALIAIWMFFSPGASGIEPQPIDGYSLWLPLVNK